MLITIASLTLREVVRRRLAVAVALLTLVAVGLTGWGFYRLTFLTDRNDQPLPHAELLLVVSFFVVFIAFMFSFILAIGAAFLAAPSLAGDVESGIALAILPRPIRRAEFVLGKWLGMIALLAAYAATAGALELVVVRLITGYTPPHPAIALAFLVGQGIVLLTIALLFSSRLAPITAGIVALVLFGLAFIAGVAGTIGSQFGNQSIVNASTTVSLILPTDGMWRGAVFNLEPEVVVAAMRGVPGRGATGGAPFMTDYPPSLPLLEWTLGWLLVVLGCAIWSFKHRDL